jgi:23S rRNA pseudouridine1911/1915/1917 synthase
MSSCEKENWIIGEDECGSRLDKALAAHWPQFSRSYFQNCIDSGAVVVNDAPARASYLLEPGDCVAITWPPREVEELMAADIPLDVLYEDDDIMVINKPAGLVVHPGVGNRQGTLVSALLYREPEVFAAFSDHEYRPGIVHRLDKDTSGAMVISRNLAAWEKLKESFREHEVSKLYLTIVRGHFSSRTGAIDAPIGRSVANRMKMTVSAAGRPALTKYRLLAEFGDCSLLLVRIYTGRTHQIRVHLAHIGHPVLGDALYCPSNFVTPPPFEAPRQLLHAWKIALPHPADGRMMTFCAPLPEDMRTAVKIFSQNADLSALLG